MGKDKKNKFKTPEGYFDNFHDRLMDRIKKEDSQEENSIIPKSDGFAVPETYFEDLTPKVMAQLEPKEVKVVQLKSYKKIYYSIAGVAAVLLLFFGLNGNHTDTVTFDDLANSELEAYFDTTDFNLSSYEIAEVISLEQIELSDMLDHNLGEEQILEYLDENVEDIEDLNLDYNDYD